VELIYCCRYMYYRYQVVEKIGTGKVLEHSEFWISSSPQARVLWSVSVVHDTQGMRKTVIGWPHRVLNLQSRMYLHPNVLPRSFERLKEFCPRLAAALQNNQPDLAGQIQDTKPALVR
jgi:hypothetical protein